MSDAVAVHDYIEGGTEAALEFLKRTRNELRELRRVRIWSDHFQIYDINGDFFRINNLGFEDPEIVPLLNNINTVYNPETIHEPTDEEYKEFKAGRRRPWAEDRVM